MNVASNRAISSAIAAACMCAATAATAATVWTDWASVTPGAPGTVTGTLNGVGVTYTGEVDSAVINGTTPIWGPDTSFVGGTSTSSPSTVKDTIFLDGTSTGTNTLTFDTPIVNPLIAIWSLGAPSTPASFNFLQATPILQAGGPSSIYGGATISVSGNTVTGRESNGVVQFNGTFTSLSWTNTPENYYAFTVGTAGIVPEPSQVAMLLAGAVMLGVGLKRRK